jgi:2-dehydro-3-deoxygalactonokinase
MTPRPALIGVDWGSTNLRAMLVGDDATVLARRSAEVGAASLPSGTHAAELARVIGDWRGDGLPVVVCGMAGARNGWREVPYLPCPANAAALHAGLVEVEPGVCLVPGVKCEDGDALRDVMRGEETQAIGLAPAADDELVLCPGTHSKWIRVVDGHISTFRTCVTGELFAALWPRWQATAPIPDAPAWPAFERGVEAGRASPLPTALFSARIGYVAGTLAAGEVYDYLSGLVIGAEIAACADLVPAACRLVGAPALARRYARALALRGVAVAAVDAEACVARGLLRVSNGTLRA